MTVEELKEELESYDDDMEVLIDTGDVNFLVADAVARCGEGSVVIR